MAKLIPPKPETVMVRYGGFWNSKKWHILRPKSEQTSICSRICIDPEYSTLAEVKAKGICNRCWPYEKE
jgi:hypothetical protein